MKKYCVTTLVCGNDFQWYIPLFVFTFRRAYPNIDIKIFLWEKAVEQVKALYPDTMIEIAPFISLDKITPNTARFLTGPEYFWDYEYVYYTDIDFLFFRHCPSLMEYMNNALMRGKECYAGMRGPIRVKNPEHPIQRWDGDNTRIAGGAFMASKKWLARTNGIVLSEIERLQREGIPYREQDEILLYNICKKAGLKTPDKRGCFIAGEKYDFRYRNIHLGDFKFDHRWKNIEKMRTKWLADENMRTFAMLEMNPQWQKLVTLCCANSNTVKTTMENLRNYVKMRNI